MKKLTLLLVSFFAVFALGLTGCSDDPGCETGDTSH